MSTIEVKDVLDTKQLGEVVEKSLIEQAAKPTNSLTQSEVTSVAPSVKKDVVQEVVQQMGPVLEHLSDTEPFWQSRQWWIAMLSLAGSLLGIFGIVFPPEMQQEVLAIVMAIIGAVSSATLIYNRYFAKRPLFRK